jgi:hypothetical protein
VTPGRGRNRIILQNPLVYNIRGSRYFPPRFPLGLRTVAFRLTILSPSLEGSYGPEYNPPRPLPCLLLKPTSAHHANCPIGSTCRPTRASVLSGHIDSVTVAAIICHAPQQKLLRVTLPGLPFTARPTVSSRSYRPYSRSHAPYDCFSAPTNQSVCPILLLLRQPAMPVRQSPAMPV